MQVRRQFSSRIAPLFPSYLTSGQYTTVFQAEVNAIKACIMENLDRNYRNRNIDILSDSQAALKALGKHQLNSKLVWDCHQTLTELSKHNGTTDMGARA
jgi:hypothetical protein